MFGLNISMVKDITIYRHFEYFQLTNNGKMIFNMILGNNICY